MFVMATLYLSCLSSRANCIIKTENHTRGDTRTKWKWTYQRWFIQEILGLRLRLRRRRRLSHDLDLHLALRSRTLRSTPFCGAGGLEPQCAELCVVGAEVRCFFGSRRSLRWASSMCFCLGFSTSVLLNLPQAANNNNNKTPSHTVIQNAIQSYQKKITRSQTHKIQTWLKVKKHVCLWVSTSLARSICWGIFIVVLISGT